jgi:hypothetical protein
MRNNQLKVAANMLRIPLALFLHEKEFAQIPYADSVFTPSSASTVAVEVYEGEVFETQVIIETGSVPISVFDLHLAFDNEFLQVVEVEMLSEAAFNYHLPADFSNNEGKLDLAAFHIGADVSEDFVVANITFMAESPTELTQVAHPMNVFPKSVIAYRREDVTGEVGNLDVTIVGSPLSDGIEDQDGIQIGMWPNPTNDITKLSFELKESNQISLRLYSAEGKLVKTIFEGNAQAGIPYQFEISVSDLAQGNYTAQLVAGDSSFSKKLTVTR